MDSPDAVLVKSSRLKSVVWNDFDKVQKGDTCVAICRHCKKKLSGSSTSGTSHLRNHLIRCQRRSNHGIAQFVTPREKKKDKALALANIRGDQEQINDDVLNVVNIRFEQEQLRDNMFNTLSYNFDQRRSRLDLARMIILHGYPLSMVEHFGFRVFVQNLQPLFELVSVDRVESDCMEIYAKERQKVTELLDNLSGKISISVDIWSSLDHDEYLCPTAYFIDESWQLNKKVLDFILVDPSLTEDMQSEALMASLMEWDIDRKLFSMTFDCSSTNDNISCRIKDRLSQNRFLYCDGQLFDVRCAVNILNMMAADAVEALSVVLSKIRQSILYIKSSQETQAKFNDMAQKAEVQTQRYPSLDTPLQWNTTYHMLAAALEYREAFSLLQEHDACYTICPSNEEWARAGVVSSFLKLFHEVICVLKKNKSPTANVYFPELCDVHLQLIDWSKSSYDFTCALGSIVKSKFEAYWEKCGSILAIATVLDPRFKMKLLEYYYPQLYGAAAQERISAVFSCVKALYNEHSIGSPLASDQGITCQVGTNALPAPAKASRDRLIGFDKFLHETSQNESTKSDLDKYLDEPLFPRNVEFCVLNWWKVHTPRYPVLSMMARNVLGIPMSKVAPDFACGTGGRMLDRDWSSLNPPIIRALMCSQDWIRGEIEK